MCGICGIFDLKSEQRSDLNIVKRMTSAIRHRGPDAIDFYFNKNVALGFARLSILDLENGMQPIGNEDNSLILLCNGEITNYKQLRSKLEDKGHRFKTVCDIEVLLHLYEEEGEDAVNYLNGQFAFVIYDIPNASLFCARDYAGIAPFFYTITDGFFIFSSEIKGILEHPRVKRKADLTGLDQIMTFPGLISPRTMFQDIMSLESGHYLKVKDGKITNREYWDLIYPTEEEQRYKKSQEYYIERLDDLIEKSIKYRLQSDVPVGFYLSGGLDSSMIAAKASKLSNHNCRHSFSIDFSDKNLSEGKYQKVMHKQLGSIHTEKLLFLSDITENLRRVIYHAEAPIKETYNAASIVLSQMVREKGVKVILTGEGADELFGGYIGYRFDKARTIPEEISPEQEHEMRMRDRIWGDRNLLYEKDYYSFAQSKNQIYSAHVLQTVEKIDCTGQYVINKERISRRSQFCQRSYIDFKLRMSDHLLSDHGDRMAYANSIEARYPFLDKELIEFAVGIPDELKLKGYNEKYILKKIASGFIPQEIVQRPKFAFTAPGSTEILKRNVEYVEDMLSYERIKRQGYFNPDTVEELKIKYKTPGFRLNVPYDSDLLIIVLTFGIWLDEFKIPAY